MIDTSLYTPEYLLEQTINTIVLVGKIIVLGLIAIVKSVLPSGLLPRKDVKGQTCLITGSGSGIGRLMAIEFAKVGCDLVLWDVNEKGNEETKNLLSKSGVKVYAYTVDLSKREQINATADKVKKEVGNVDILINNAGIVTGKKIFECPDELMEKTMAVNTNACLFTAKNFVKGMIDRNHGHLVTVASVAGKSGNAGLVDYCASKYGAVGFHESLTAELFQLKADGVKTTLVCPYFINTGMFDGAKTKSPNLLPILEPEYAVGAIMEAVLTDRREVFLPKLIYWDLFAASFLPTDARNLYYDYMGAHDSMHDFTGRK